MLLCAALLLASAFPGAASAQIDAYIQVTEGGAPQLTGVSNRGAPVLGLGQSMTVPYDPADGRPTTWRQHVPLTIRRPVDVDTPFFITSQNLLQELDQVDINFWQLSPVTNQPVHSYTIQLTKAFVVGYSQGAGSDDALPTETISFTYDVINWTWEDGGVTSSGSWVP